MKLCLRPGKRTGLLTKQQKRRSMVGELKERNRGETEVKGAEGQTRTVDTGIFSAVLYHLSYLG